MFSTTLLLACSLIGADAAKAQPTTAAERVTLRDGSVILGVVKSASNGRRGVVEMLVRREWAEQHLKPWIKRWDRAIEAGAGLAARQRRQRLQTWRRERSEGVPADDRINSWIDQELKRLSDPARFARTALMPVRLSRGEIRDMALQPRRISRLIKLGWLCALPEVETMPVDDLKEAVEERGFSPDGKETPPLDALLPLAPESDLQWLARRAATELATDSNLRFIRYQDLILPDVKNGQPLNGLNLSTALAELTRLLDPGQDRTDPLAAILQTIGARGRVGAVVTRLEIPPDLSHATVEATLWIRAGGARWIPYGSRSATVRPEELPPEAGQNLNGDPQVQSAFQIVEMLGLGTISPELKQRSLRMGAATEKALGTARTEIEEELSKLILPVLEQRFNNQDQRPNR